MLTNNFKVLFNWGSEGNFTDVLGHTVAKKYKIATNYYYNNRRNDYWASASNTLNYSATTATNTFTDETTIYTYTNIVISEGYTSINVSGITYYVPSGNGLIIFLGTGDTAEKEGDYCLASPVKLTPTSAACLQDANGKTVVQRSFTNGTGADVTVKEIGLYLFGSKSGFYTAGSNPDNSLVMIARKVLETPVTIANGDTTPFQYTLDFSQIVS